LYHSCCSCYHDFNRHYGHYVYHHYDEHHHHDHYDHDNHYFHHIDYHHDDDRRLSRREAAAAKAAVAAAPKAFVPALASSPKMRPKMAVNLRAPWLERALLQKVGRPRHFPACDDVRRPATFYSTHDAHNYNYV